MNPEKSNQIPQSVNYYNNREVGMVYQAKDEGKSDQFTFNKQNDEPAGRPVKRLYINFDKDIASRMFGYRVNFVREDMKSYVGEGMPSVYAP